MGGRRGQQLRPVTDWEIPSTDHVTASQLSEHNQTSRSRKRGRDGPLSASSPFTTIRLRRGTTYRPVGSKARA